MELEFDATFEIKVFSCNHSLMNNDDETVGVCYVECGSHSAYNLFVGMLDDVFHDQEICVVPSDNFSDEGEFDDGFIVWQKL